jgi:hypothetical protein
VNFDRRGDTSDGRRRQQPGDDGQRAAGVPVRAPGGAQAAGHAQVLVQRLARRLRQGLLRVRAHHAPGLLPLQAPPPRRHQPRRRRRGPRARRRSEARRGPANGARRRSTSGQVVVRLSCAAAAALLCTSGAVVRLHGAPWRADVFLPCHFRDFGVEVFLFYFFFVCFARFRIMKCCAAGSAWQNDV